jgi:L-arabinose isomerase
MNESKDNKEIESIHILDKLSIGDVISSVKEISYDDIEKLTEEVQDFIKRKGFDIYDESEFLTRLEKVLYEGIDKHYD